MKNKKSTEGTEMSELLQKIRKGDRTALSKAITLIES
ncbi:MAG: hypothetical protein ABEH43_04175, partial [Flavobacteriales bacterium]